MVPHPLNAALGPEPGGHFMFMNGDIMMQLSKLATSAAFVMAGSAAIAGEVEVLHWWTSGGEAKSVGELKRIMQSERFARRPNF